MQYFSFSQIGRKSENQDRIGISENCFVICDGVGGANSGEIASSTIASFLTENTSTQFSSNTQIQEIVKKAVQNLNSLVEQEPNFTGTATTLAAVFPNKSQGIFTAHVGDSRIFVTRPSQKKFWHTWDHSLVGDLVKNGEITREQGRNHPMNNRIYKALKGDLSATSNSNSEIHLVSDIITGDRIFICSDGVLEAYSDLDLIELLWDSKRKVGDILSEIQEECKEKSIDNNSAILLEVEQEDFQINKKQKLNWMLKKDLIKNKEDNKPTAKQWTSGIMSFLKPKKK